jgi:polysaccharide biosynthesis transport protein
MAELGIVIPSQPGKAPEVGSLRLARLRQELEEMKTRYTAKHPDVIRLNAEIKQVEAELAVRSANGQTAVDPTASGDPQLRRLRHSLAEADTEIANLKKEATYVRDAIATYQRRVESTPDNEGQYQELSRDYDSTKQLYATLLKRFEDAQLAETLESKLQGEQFRIIDPATVTRPVSRLKPALAGLVLSLGAVVVSVVVAERLDRSFHAIDDVRHFTRVPIVASISRIATQSDVKRARQLFRLAAVSVAGALVIVVIGSFGLAYNNEPLARMLTIARH